MSKELTLQDVRAKVLTLPGRPPFLLGRDLAAILGVSTRLLSQTVRRNPDLFPEPDAVFVLTSEEKARLLQEASITQPNVVARLLGYALLGCNMSTAFARSPVAKKHLLLIMRAITAAQAAQALPPTDKWGERELVLSRSLYEQHKRLRMLERRIAAEEKRGDAVRRLEALVEKALTLEEVAATPPVKAPEVPPTPPEPTSALAAVNADGHPWPVGPAPKAKKTRRAPGAITMRELARMRVLRAAGMSYREIGRVIGSSENAIRRALLDGRA